MAKLGKAAARGSRQGPRDRVLMAKYLDYCSARVADALLKLTADEMYILAQEVAGQTTGPDAEVPSFSRIVRLATERLTSDLKLPEYSEWVQAYEADPTKFDQDMIGLWREDATTSEGVN